MGKISRNQLQWIGRNHQAKCPEELLGTVAARQMRAHSITRGTQLVKLLELIGQWSDGDFRAHCTLEGFSGGVLEILVDHESLVAPMRRKWTIALKDILSTEFRGSHVGDIRFSPGRSDLVFVKHS